MEYLSEVKVLHCDLAARNILLTKDYMAKIADFGLSKLMTGDKDYYTRKGQDFIPLMWYVRWRVQMIVAVYSS